jgi:hypothetical protein
MAVLSLAARQQIWRGLQRYWSAPDTRRDIAIDKADLQAAVNATDAWIDTNATTYNLAIPQPARNNLTAEQKTFMFCVVALARVSPETLRRLIGEID